MSKYYDPMEPIFFTPPNQAAHPVGGRILFKGGGGSGQREATAEEKRLWAAQAQSLEGMNAVAMPSLTTGMNNLGTLANESMDGTLETRLRDQALSDVNVSLGTSANDALRTLGARGGIYDPTSARGADTMASWGLNAAKQRAGAARLATTGAEDMKWNRNAALTGLASGQGAQSVSGMGQLASQIGQTRMQGGQMAIQEQQAQGAGTAGLLIGGKMMGLYKDGGRVKKKEPRFAGGGMARFGTASMPKIAPYSFQADDRTPAADGGMMKTVAGVAAPVMGARMAANGLGKIGISAPKQAIDGLGTAAKDVIASFGTDTTFTPIATEKAAEAAAAADTAEATGTAGNAFAAGELAADAELANAATTAGAAGGLGTAAAAAAPWLVGGYALGSALDLWADGGRIKRKNMTPGGKVAGPGTGTSDSVPARLSDGEGVVNTRAMGMSKAETQQVVEDWQKNGGGADDLVLAINDKGLEKRHGKAKARANPRYEGGAQKMALGGIAMALGNGIYQAAPMLNQMDQQQKMDERWAKENARADSAEARAAATHGIMLEDRSVKKAKEAKAAEIMGAWAGRMRQMGEAAQAMGEGKLSSYDFATSVAPEYSRLIQDGKTLQPLADGSFALTDGAGPKASTTKIGADEAAKYLASPEMLMKARRQMYEELAAVDPAYAARADALLGQEIESSSKARDMASREKIAAGHDAATRDVAVIREKGDAGRHAASLGVQWANLSLTKSEREEARRREVEKADSAVALFKQNNPGASDAQINAVRSGVLAAVPKEAKNEFSFVQNPLGMGGTRVNKDTGEVQGVNEKGEVLYTLPPAAGGAKPGAGWSARDVTNRRNAPKSPVGSGGQDAVGGDTSAATQIDGPKKGVLGVLRDSFNDETGTVPLSMRNARAKNMLPAIRAKQAAGIALTASEADIARQYLVMAQN